MEFTWVKCCVEYKERLHISAKNENYSVMLTYIYEWKYNEKLFSLYMYNRLQSAFWMIQVIFIAILHINKIRQREVTCQSLLLLSVAEMGTELPWVPGQYLSCELYCFPCTFGNKVIIKRLAKNTSFGQACNSLRCSWYVIVKQLRPGTVRDGILEYPDH